MIGDRSEKNVIENEGRGTSVIVIVRGERMRGVKRKASRKVSKVRNHQQN